MTHLYGIATVEPTDVDDVVKITGLVEKPAQGEAPSNLAIIGRYVIRPEVFDVLEKQEPGKGGEIQLTDAIEMLATQEPLFAAIFDEGRFDVGTPIEHLKATVELAARHPELGGEFRAFLDEFMKRS